MSDTWIRDLIIPPEMKRIARERLSGLMHPSVLQTATFDVILESAYLQGAADVALALQERGERVVVEDENLIVW